LVEANKKYLASHRCVVGKRKALWTAEGPQRPLPLAGVLGLYLENHRFVVWEEI
jgi:hypothetical protein